MDLCVKGLERSKRMDGYFQKNAPNSQSSAQEGRAVRFPSLQTLLHLVLFLFLLLCVLLLDVFLAFFLSPSQTQ